MPFKRCWNFEHNGSRKTWPNGTEMQCRPDCSFVHPSEPGWDRAPAAPARGKGPPQSGRGRGQSSFGLPATGANSSTLGMEQGGSGTWDDYMTGFNSNPRATSSARGAPSRRGGQTTSGTSGWGSSGADGPGWGSSGADGPGWGSSGADGPGWGSSGADNPGWGSPGAEDPGLGSSANNNGNPLDGWSNEPGASGEQASSSQWDTPAVEWGTTGTDLGPDWGDTSIVDQGKKASSATKVSNIAGPDALSGGTGTDDNPDVATVATPLSPAIPSILTSGELNATHKKERGEDTSAPATPLATKSIKMRPSHVDYDNHFFSTLSGTDKMGFLIAMTLKMRELDAELSQLSALRKSRQIVVTRVAKELVQIEVRKFTEAQAEVEAEHNACSGKLTQSDLSCPSNVQHALATLGRENWRFEQLKDWVSRAETCLSHVQDESSPDSPIEKSNGATFVSQLNQLKGRSESLAEIIWQCQGQQFYNAFLDDQIQDKKDPILAAIAKGQDITYSHLVLTSLFPLQRQGEAWHQTLQIQAGKLAQALLQADQLKKNKNYQSTLEKGAIQQQLQVDIAQKRLQLQALQEEMAQLHHTLTSIEQQSVIKIDTLEEYVQRYIQANATFIIQAELSKAEVQFTTTGLRTIEKVWTALQPSTQMSIWLQHSDIHKTEEELEIREIEESLLA